MVTQIFLTNKCFLESTSSFKLIVSRWCYITLTPNTITIFVRTYIYYIILTDKFNDNRYICKSSTSLAIILKQNFVNRFNVIDVKKMPVKHVLCQDNDLINTYLHHLNDKGHVLSHFEYLNKAQSFGVPHGIYIQIFLAMLQIYIYLYLSIKDIYPNVFLFSIKLLTWYIFSTTLQQSFSSINKS